MPLFPIAVFLLCFLQSTEGSSLLLVVNHSLRVNGQVLGSSIVNAGSSIHMYIDSSESLLIWFQSRHFT